MNDATRPRLVLMGRILGAFGVRGELKVESYSEPLAAVLRYRPWILRDAQGLQREVGDVRGRETAKGVVARLPGVEDRDAAEALRGTAILVPRAALPPPAPGEYYWVDLEGLRVRTVDGVALGTVAQVLPTGANDVLVVRGDRERMIPFVQPRYVTAVDLEAGTLTVDWDPDF
jgi:16S rRNA processing protein RimM